MPSHIHSYFIWHSCPNEISDGRPTEVVEHLTMYPRCNPGVLPSFFEATDLRPVAMKDPLNLMPPPKSFPYPPLNYVP
jgi:hypothetical protein